MRLGVDFGGAGPASSASKFGGGYAAAPAPEAQAPDAGPGARSMPSPMTVVLALLGVILALRLVGDSPKTSIEGSHIHVGGYNVLVILTIVWFGTVFAKLVLNRWQVPALTEVINTV